MVLNKFYTHIVFHSTFPRRPYFICPSGIFLLLVTIFCKTRSFNCPDNLNGESLFGALLHIMEEVLGCVLHGVEFSVIHFLVISNKKFLYLIFFFCPFFRITLPVGHSHFSFAWWWSNVRLITLFWQSPIFQLMTKVTWPIRQCLHVIRSNLLCCNAPFKKLSPW